MLIEVLSGVRYRDFIRARVLNPAGMHNSGLYAFNDLPENTANGYLEDRRTTNIYHLPLRGGGDGGMYTTTGDLRAFWEALLAGEILSAALTGTFLSTQQAINATVGYGCGVYKRLDGSMYSIIGGDAGVGFDSRRLVADRLTINILSNITNGENAIRSAVLGAL
jgi:CubicO group peptidase (beta-lactamase class C family)